MIILRALTVVGLFLGATGFARADTFTVNIDDLNGNTGVTINGVAASLLSDSSGEFVHFTLPLSQSFNLSGFSVTNDLWEGPSGPVSDRLVQTGFNNSLDIQFGSVPGTLPTAGSFSFPPIVEDGTFQNITNTSIAFGNGTEDNFFFYVRSDSPSSATPFPSTFVMSSILFGMFGVVWSYKRIKQTAAAA